MEKSSKNTVYRTIGLMSGTSLDGIDAAMIETDGYDYIKPIGFQTAEYSPEIHNLLKSCLNSTQINSDIEREFTLAQIPVIKKLLQKTGFTPADIDFIGFHGQTIHHAPENGVTIQMGDGELLANEIGINVIHDFRTNDVKNGGQGAPLIPIYHKALIKNSELELPLAIINLGGVGNITWISDDDMIAFDTGPANAMIDDWVKKHTDKNYDEGGQFAKSGKPDNCKILEFTKTPYFLKKYPKSLDRNDFINFNVEGMDFKDGVTTLAEISIQSIIKGIDICPSPPKIIFITGGGRHNKYIMDRLNELTDVPVKPVEALQWNGDMIEAEGFAYMAVRSHLKLPLSFPNTTGCPHPLTGGRKAILQ